VDAQTTPVDSVTPVNPPAQSKHSQILVMLTQGKSVPEIAEALGVTRAYVYTTKTKAKANGTLALAPAKRGRPKGSKNKPKKPPMQLVRKDVLANLKEEIATLKSREPIFVEVPVPQPISHYSFMQRLKILFFKRV
jgi:transposase